MSSNSNLINRLRILHVIDHLGVGGAQTIVKFLIDNVENSFAFVLRSSSNNSQTNKKIYFSGVISKWSILSLFSLLKLVKDKEIEVVDCHLFKAKIFGLLVKLVYPNIILIFHEHGSIKTKIIYVALLKFFSFLPDKYLVVSKKIKNELLEIIPNVSNNVYLLENAVFIEKPSKKNVSVFRRKYHIKENVFKIGYVGRLHHVKGCVELIQAVSTLQFSYQLIIVGDGNLRDKLKNMVDHFGITDSVIFTGAIDNVADAYSNFDILVAPSKNESFGLTALEAQVMRVPVIATSQFVGLNKLSALIISDITSSRITDAINLIYSSNSLRKKLILNGVKNVDRYSTDVYVKKYKHILNYQK